MLMEVVSLPPLKSLMDDILEGLGDGGSDLGV